jgi:hypothetical protein
MDNLDQLGNAIPDGNNIFQEVQLGNLEVGKYYLMKFDNEYDHVKVLIQPFPDAEGQINEDNEGQVQTYRQYRNNEWNVVNQPGEITIIHNDNKQRVSFYIPDQQQGVIIGGRKKRSRKNKKSRKSRKASRKNRKASRKNRH